MYTYPGQIQMTRGGPVDLNAPRCGFAAAGTYGHECGSPATLAGARLSSLTKSGIYWAKRCPACAEIVGGENRGIRQFVPLDLTLHRNEWR